MNFKEWLGSVPKEIAEDTLWRMEVYRVSLFAGDLAWRDVGILIQDRRMLRHSDQLYSAVGSISANIAEGYSRSSNKDQVRFYEYSLGSGREARNWYFGARHVLGDAVSTHRMQLLTQIIKHLLRIIPSERGVAMKEETLPYQVSNDVSDWNDLLENVPLTPTNT